MKNRINIKNFAKFGVVMAALAVVAVPAVSHAASYAYVDSFGEVRQVTASTWQQAIDLAPNIGWDSGVYLMDNSQRDADMIGE